MKLLSSVVFASVVLVAAPAFATDNDAKVNEVMLSNQGSTLQQFIEIEEPGGGPFDSGGYVFQVFGSTTSNEINFQPIAIAGTKTRIILSTDAARAPLGLPTSTSTSGSVAYLNLNFELPANGTACFKRSGVFIHCLSWGAVTSRPTGTNGNSEGPAPTDGKSLQRLATCAGVATPTPDAVNSATCPPPGSDAGVPDAMPNGDGGTGGNDGGTGSNGEHDDGDDGCSITAGAGWFGIVGVAGLFAIGRVRRRQA